MEDDNHAKRTELRRIRAGKAKGKGGLKRDDDAYHDDDKKTPNPLWVWVFPTVESNYFGWWEYRGSDLDDEDAQGDEHSRRGPTVDEELLKYIVPREASKNNNKENPNDYSILPLLP